MMKKISLELGGKNAALVFADANLDLAVKTLIQGAFKNQGEICLCTSRIYVQDSIYDTFLERFVNETRKLIIGDPNDPEVFMGALNSKIHLEKVVGYAKIKRRRWHHPLWIWIRSSFESCGPLTKWIFLSSNSSF